MKTLLLIFISWCFLVGQAQPIRMRTVAPVEIEKIEYTNKVLNTTSSEPYPGKVVLTNGSTLKGKITFFKKKDVFERVKIKTETGTVEIRATEIKSLVLDPMVSEGRYPNNFKKPEKNFQPGYVVLPTGEKLNGRVAQLRFFSDYDFFTYAILFLPENSNVASGIQGGMANEFGQMIDGTMRIWDGYADGYLLRIVDGRFRLGRNPYSTAKSEFFTSLRNNQTESNSITESIKSGININESIEIATNASRAIMEAMGAIDLNKKEFLIFDSKNNSVIAVDNQSFKPWAESVAGQCGGSPPPNWDTIEDFMRSLNEKCK